MSKISPFTWVDAVSNKTGDPMAEHGEEAYPAFMVTRALSYFPDCCLYAAEMNAIPNTDNKIQYDYFYHSIRKKKRFSKWGKKKAGDDELKAVMSHYGYNIEKAEGIMPLLTDEQLADIVELEKVKE